MLRSAHAFGASCVALGPGCADPYSPKAVRASMGAIFAVALARVRRRRPSCPASASRWWPARAEPLRGPASAGDGLGRGAITLLVGAEREGLPDERGGRVRARARASRSRRDSLNAAMAATVALYEMTRRPY